MRPDPKPWPLTLFGDVVRNVNDNVRDPLSSDLERYVGLDHLDPESLHIKRWGLIADGTTFTRKFVAGQVLFGKRRAYQRKVAVAEFDGICSGDILVFEPANDQLLPELLPFIVQSDGFFRHALGTSAGSLSPRTKWQDLARYEFALPPLDGQRRIAEILWAADEALEANNAILERLTVLKSVTLESNLSNGGNHEVVDLGELLLDSQYGTSKRSGTERDGAVPVLRIPNVLKDRLDLSDLSWAILTSDEQERYAAHDGDILLVRTNGNPLYVGRSVVVKGVPEGTVFASYLIRLRVDESHIKPDYLNILLNSEYLRRTLRHEIRSSAGNYNINTKGIRRQRIPLPSISGQDQIIQEIKYVDAAIAQCELHITQSQALKTFLLRWLLSEKHKEA